MQLDVNRPEMTHTSMMSMEHEETLPHQDHPVKQAEHQELLDLVPHSAATHIAVNDGSWFDPNTWQQGQVPGTDAKVVISEGVHVTYDAESDTRLETVRVDGTLEFAHNRNTKIVVDTFIASPTSTLMIGSEANPIQADKTARIVIADNGEIDANWDSTLISRGVVTHGQVRIHGADKLDFISLKNDVSAGDNELVLDLPEGMNTPDGWQIGDQLVLGGTSYNPNGSDEDNSRFQDEVLTITEINGNRIKFTNNDITSGDNTVLRFDHERPQGFENEDLKLYIANTSRNVIFETENAETVPTQQRGHVMFMHNPDVEVQNAGFYNLGRTDKNRLIDDPGENVDGSPGSGTNPRGRYALHLHRTGAEDINSTPSLVKGNAIVGSPGWGIVHHDSHAVLEDNVVFDVVGSGIAAEAGNELGAWRNNITIKTTGDDRPQADFDGSDRVPLFDMGFNGEGYWVQGAAQVEMVDNIAISAAGGGINIFNGVDGISEVREADTIAVDNLSPELQSVLSQASYDNDSDTLDVTNVPLRRLSGFESYNSDFGMIFWNHLRNNDGQFGFQGPNTKEAHDVRSLVDNFKLWNIYGEGIFTQYSSQIDFVDGLIVGDTDNPVPFKRGINGDGRGYGIGLNPLSQDLLFKDIRVEGFEHGVKLPWEGPNDGGVSFLGSRIEDSYLANNTHNLSKQKSFGNSETFPDYFEVVNTTFEVSPTNITPVADFTYESVGNQGVVLFDASASFDSDPPDTLEQTNEAIASYGWDFDNDGSIDEFGRQVNHQFDPTGSHNVSLTVWDSQGATSTVTQQIEVTPTAYNNLILDSDFSDSGEFGGPEWNLNSTRTDEGWLGTGWSRDPNIGDGGAAVFTDKSWKTALGQVFLDNQVRQGQQTLSLDIKNTEGDEKANEITVRLWGVEGEFSGGIGSNGPTQAGAIPMNRTLLLEETVGGSTFDWTNFEWDVDFGDGYQFVVFSVNSNRYTSDSDFIAVDNVVLESPAINPPPLESEPEPVVNSDPRLLSPIPDQTLEVQESLSLDITNHFSDPDGDTLTYSATLEDGTKLPSWLSLDSNTGLLSGTPNSGDESQLSILVTANDGQGGTKNDVFGLDISPAPVVDNSLTNPFLVLDSQLQGKIELIDLRNQTGLVNANLINIESNAGFNNSVGLYVIQNEEGAVEDPITGQLIDPEDDGYAKAALAQRVVSDIHRGMETFNTQLEGGNLFAPYIIANATMEEWLAENPDNEYLGYGKPIAYFSHIGANPDQVDHISLLGDNSFGFEDLYRGGDNDMNDIMFDLDFAVA